MSIRDYFQLHPFFRPTVMLMGGIVVANALGDRVSPYTWLTLSMAVFAVAFLCRAWAMTQSVLLLLSYGVLGAFVLSAYRERTKVTLPEEECTYEAVVLTEPEVRGRVVRCDLLMTRGPLVGKRVKASILRDTVENRYRRLHAGSGLCAMSRLEKPVNFYPQSHFDYALWMQIHGFCAQTFIYYKNWEERKPDLERLSGWERLRLKADGWRRGLLDVYRRNGLSGEDLAVVAAMTLGYKSALSKSLKEVYSVTGASHVLALSGLHLGILYFFLSFLLLNRRWRVGGQLLQLTLIWGYVVMVGMPPSVVRSAVMLTLYSLVSLLNRDKMSLNTLSLAALLMLLANPLLLWDVGFQMSFMAVLGIVVFYRPFYHALGDGFLLRHWLLRKPWSLLSVSLAAQLGVLPLVAYYFGRFSCYFLLTNLLVVPCVMVIVYGAVILLLAFPFPAVQQVLGGLLGSVARLQNHGLSWMASLPGASLEHLQVSRMQVAAYYLFLFFLCWHVRYLRRWYRLYRQFHL